MHKVPNVCVVPELGHNVLQRYDAQNIPVPLNLENVKSKGEERIRGQRQKVACSGWKRSMSLGYITVLEVDGHREV